MTLSRRTVLAAAVLAAPALISRARAGQPVLRLANFKGGDKLLMKLAGQDGPGGYTPQWSEFASGNVMLEAINADAIDLAYGSEIPPVFLAGGGRVRQVAVIRDDVNQQTVLVPKGSAIASIADLRGKRVGYVRATTTHYYLLRMLAEQGMTFADIKPVNLAPADGQAAFRSGAIDAWAIYGYSVPLALDGGARVLRTAAGILSGNFPFFANPVALADPARRAAIVEHLVRLNRAFHWIDAHHVEYAQAQGDMLGVPPAALQSLLDGASRPRRLGVVDDAAIASQQAVADTFTSAGLLPGHVDVAPLWDRSLTASLAKETA